MIVRMSILARQAGTASKYFLNESTIKALIKRAALESIFDLSLSPLGGRFMFSILLNHDLTYALAKDANTEYGRDYPYDMKKEGI